MSHNLVLPIVSRHCTETKNIEVLSMNTTRQWSNHSFSDFRRVNEHSLIPRVLPRAEVKTTHADSTTFERLWTARMKLKKWSHSIPSTLPASEHIKCKVPHSSVHVQRSSTATESVQPSLSSQKRIEAQLDPLNEPHDEGICPCEDSKKQKLSLEIWLPKADFDNDDGYISRTVTPEVTSASSPTIERRRTSSIKTIPPITILSTESETLDKATSKPSEPAIKSYHDQSKIQIQDSPKGRASSREHTMAIKSDDGVSIRNLRSSHASRPSISMNHSEDILHYKTLEMPTSVTNLPVPLKSTNSNHDTKLITKFSNSSRISLFMQKYSLLKKMNSTSTEDRSRQVRLPLVFESTTFASLDFPTVSVKKLLTTTEMRSDNHRIDASTKPTERCATANKSSHSIVNSQVGIFNRANQRQQYQSFLSGTSPALQSSFVVNKIDDTFRPLQRSKTFDSVSNAIKATSSVSVQANNFLSDSFRYTLGEILEQTPCLVSKQSTFTLRSKQKH